MAVLNIRQYDDDILRKKSKEVLKIDKNILTILDDMAETMYKNDGVGLAAPQVGILRRMVVIDLGEGLIELINPVILEKKDPKLGQEGCLSVLGKAGYVTRANYCKVKALNRHGEEIIIEGTELMARALQHEIDHLEGIIYTDLVEGELFDAELQEPER